MKMEINRQKLLSMLAIGLSILAVLVCCGTFVRIEMMMKEYKNTRRDMEDKATSSESKLQHQINEIMKKINMSHDRFGSTSNRAKRDDFTDHKLVQYIPKIIQAIGALQMEKKIPGPRGPQGEKGLKGDTGPRGMPGPKGDPARSLSPPSMFISPCCGVSINESQSVLLNCSVSAYPRATVVWSKENGSLPISRATDDGSGILKIVNIDHHDTGIYKCKASNALGQSQSYVKLEVNYRPRITLATVQKPIYQRAGYNITLPRCPVKGNPKPKIVWSKSLGELSNRTVIKNEQLTITDCEKEDSGFYACEAKNFLGSDKAIMYVVNIVDMPTFTTKPPSTYEAYIGMTISLNCSAKGNPKPVIRWNKEKGDLPVGRYERRDDSLILNDFKPEDAGVYICTATIERVFEISARTNLTLRKPADCSMIYKEGVRRNGVYTVWPADNQGKIHVYCDMTSDGGGWTVFQRRRDGSVDFFRNWADYKRGFGNLTGEFWLGNDFIHRLSSAQTSILRIDLEDWDGTKIYAKYGHFRIADESLKYKLEVGSFSGNGGDSMKLHNNMMFSTKDRDNDVCRASYCVPNCAVAFHGAWWYEKCYDANLNGKYLRAKSDLGIIWQTYKLKSTLKTAAMKVRPVNFNIITT